MEQKVTPPWTKGLVISLILIVYSLAIYFAGQAYNKSLSWVQFVILIAGLIVACIGFAKQKNGNVTFGNVFAHGFKTTAAIIVIMVIYTVIAFKLLFPEMMDTIMDQARADMEKQGNVTDEQITQGIEMGRKFFIPFAIGGIVLMFGICGAIASLIGAGVAKKNPNYNPLEQQ
jgi:phosphatidylglycerophosphate synthase